MFLYKNYKYIVNLFYVAYLVVLNHIITLVTTQNYIFMNTVVIIGYLLKFIINRSKENNMNN